MEPGGDLWGVEPAEPGVVEHPVQQGRCMRVCMRACADDRPSLEEGDPLGEATPTHMCGCVGIG